MSDRLILAYSILATLFAAITFIILVVRLRARDVDRGRSSGDYRRRRKGWWWWF